LAFKSETRISKFETNSNVQNPNDRNIHVLNFGHLDFGFVSDFGFRISKLGASVGGWLERYVLGVKEAQAHETVDIVTLEAEDMPTKTTGGAITNGWNVWGNGYIEEPVAFPNTTAYEFEIIAKGDYAGAIRALQESLRFFKKDDSLTDRTLYGGHSRILKLKLWLKAMKDSTV